MGDSNWFLQSDAVCSSETSDPTGLVTLRTAMVPIDSPRRYIRYAATAPATIVPQNNALFITAPMLSTCSRGACACRIWMQKAVRWRSPAQKCLTRVFAHCLTHGFPLFADNEYCRSAVKEEPDSFH